MSRKGENIRKRKDGRWEGRYKRGRDDTGKIIYGYVYGRTCSAVREKIRESIICQDIQNKKAYQFKFIVQKWLDSSKLRHKEATQLKYKSLLDNHILPEFGNLRIDAITASQINSFLSNKLCKGKLNGEGGLSPSYVKTIMIIIQSIMTFAIEENFRPPLQSKILKPKENKKEYLVLSKDDQKKLEDYIISNTDLTGLATMISLHAGLRVGEICALSWNNIDLFNRIIHIKYTITRIENKTAGKGTTQILAEPKTKASTRDIPISSYLLGFLQRAQASGFVMTGTEEFLSPRTFEYRFHRLLKLAHVEDINYHALRHTFASRCIEYGVDIKSLCEMLGHSSAMITMNTYVHSSLELKRQQIEKLCNNFAINNGQ